MKKSLVFLSFLGFMLSLNAFAYDTSGCSVNSIVRREGRVEVLVQKPPRNNCWNVEQSGVEVQYYWTQVNNPQSEANNIGFWISLNGRTQYAKAQHYGCYIDRRGGTGHDTSGQTYYVCSAARVFNFREFPHLRDYAYAPNGTPNYWDVAVAVSLDDRGNWDSRNGANYQFRF